MKFRIAISRKVLLGAAGALLVLGGGAGGAAYLGYLPLPWRESPELRGSVDAPPAEHGDKAAEAKPAEGEHSAPAEGGHAAAPAEVIRLQHQMAAMALPQRADTVRTAGTEKRPPFR